MDMYELKKEQLKLAPKVVLRDTFTKIETIGGAQCIQIENKLLACVVVCEFPSMNLLEKKTYILPNPLPYQAGYLAYREMPAIIEAFNNLEQEPDILLVKGHGIAHPRKIGLASHLGLALNKPVIGVADTLLVGEVENGKIINRNEVAGFEIKTRKHAKPVYASPGNLVSLGSVLHIIPQTIRFPHKMPEPLHLARRIAKKKAKKLKNEEFDK